MCSWVTSIPNVCISWTWVWGYWQWRFIPITVPGSTWAQPYVTEYRDQGSIQWLLAEAFHDTSLPVIFVSCRNDHFVLWWKLWEGCRMHSGGSALQLHSRQGSLSSWLEFHFYGIPQAVQANSDMLKHRQNPHSFLQWQLSEWPFGKGKQPYWGQWWGRNCTCSLYFAATERQRAPCEVHICCL